MTEASRTRALIVLLIGALVVTLVRKALSLELLGIDEEAHFSYAVEALGQGLFVDLEALQLYDPVTGEPYRSPNYLNHPPFYYLALGALAAAFELPSGGTLILLRVVSALVAGAALLFLALEVRRVVSREAAVFFALATAFLPQLGFLAGYVSNDLPALVGGCLAAAGMLAGREAFARTARPLNLLLAGLVLMTATKLTAAIIGAVLVGVFLALAAPRPGALRRNGATAALLAALVVAAAPYLWFAATYGSPAPDTFGQRLLIAHGAEVHGWDAERLGPVAYAIWFLRYLVLGWMANTHEVLAACAPVFALMALLVGVQAAGAPVDRAGVNRRAILAAALAAFAVHLAIYFGYAWLRHLETGWRADGQLRYWIPLTPVFLVILAQGVDRLSARLRGAAVAGWIGLAVVLPFLPLWLG